ncbi:hypothetical protein L1987_50055 [Smallanthus sonchifolius]|uniref:Uncharacterized protein n=1 Tax=Smallanthus sonchifolius TaxID=185202 RepID=A0ACB9FW99_9ASTR|nr:hypothetical protein L1987_50055 [Smallanthus sonchifolius]
MSYNSTTLYLQLVDELVDDYNIPNSIIYSLLEYVKPIYRSDVESKYNAPMFWIGMYIVFASLVCVLAMVADLLHGLRRGKLWFPCKYFRMNAAFLITMFVAMKLPVDLSGVIPGDVDQAGKLGSIAFMCIMMANLLPCLATMDGNELLSNITALCVLVITLVVNVCIQIQTGVVSYKKDAPVIQIISPKYDVESVLGISKHRNTILATIYVTLLLVLLIEHVCSSLAVRKSKQIMERKYQQGHSAASKDIQQSSGELLTVEKLQKHVSNHWIMAGSGSPQFVSACFPTTSVAGVICVLVTILHTITMSWTTKAILKGSNYSDYSWSMIVILIVQSIGVVIGTIAPLSRCFTILSFKVSFKIISNYFKVFEVESYWTQKLYDWKRASIRLPFCCHKLKVVIQTLKKLILSFCIEVQEGVVVICKIIALIPFSFMICVVYCLKRVKAVFGSLGHKTDKLETNKDLRPYVLQLEDEMELDERTLESLSKSVKILIRKGEKSQPNNLMNLILEKSTNGFQGVKKFDHMDHQVQSLQLKEEYQDCWSLPVVTLTTIAASLPKIEKKEVNSLLKSVREGLVYLTFVEENLNATGDYARTQEAAETLWQEVDVYHKWLGYKLQNPAFQENRAGQIVEWFSDTAKNIVYMEGISRDDIGGRNEIFKDGGASKDNTRCSNDDSISMSICANSMYRITKTILLTYQTNIDDKVSQKKLFDILSSTISDIMAACLTNLPQVITMKCHTSLIEEREARVEDAAQLLGETTQIIEFLQDRGIPGMNPSDLPFIDKWRAYLGDP